MAHHTDHWDLAEPGSCHLHFVRKVAESESPVYTFLALTPCIKLWPWFGQQLGFGSTNFSVYTSWVEENLVSTTRGYLEYEDHVRWACEDGIVPAERVIDIYTASFRSEVKFFNYV